MIYTRPRFDRAFASLTPPQQAKVKSVIARLEAAFGRPHLHSGIGVRQFGRFFEMRAGLGLRVLFLAEGGDLFLSFVGNHDQVKAFLKGRP